MWSIMSRRERKFHKLIEQQDQESRDKLWEGKIKNEIGTEEPQTESNRGNVIVVNYKKAVYPILLAVFVLVAVLLIILRPWASNPSDDFRYGTTGDYTFNKTSQTLREYSEEHHKDLLYLDWYDESEYSDWVYLNKQNEIICFVEDIGDNKAGLTITLRVADARIQLDFLERVKNYCKRSVVIKGTEVFWSLGVGDQNAYFHYGSNIYYLYVVDPPSDDYICEIAEILLRD